MSVSTLFSKLTGVCRVPMNTAQSMPFSEVPSLLSKPDLFNGGVQPKNSSPFCKIIFHCSNLKSYPKAAAV